MKCLSPEETAKALGGARQRGDEWIAHCPAHDDRTPSLSIAAAPNGSLLFHCHAGCSQEQVIAALKSRGLLPNRKLKQAASKSDEQRSLVCPIPTNAPTPIFEKLCGRAPTKIYAYLSASGQTLGYQCRVEVQDGGKRFVPVTAWTRQDNTIEWRAEGLPAPRPLYGLQSLAARPTDPVLIVEGEKTADAAAKLFPEHVVITWSNGANGVGSADWTPLKNRRVTIWPDNDEPGQKAAREIAARLRDIDAHGH